MDLYLKVRLAHFQDGLSGRQIAGDFGISRDSVSKMLAYSEPPGYRRTAVVKRPKLDAYADQIDQWLAEDKRRPRKQRHTAKRIFERLGAECGFVGGYTIVKDYVRTKKCGSLEMFVPLNHPPGHAQADFGEALVVIGGVEQKAYFFALDLPHSDACYTCMFWDLHRGLVLRIYPDYARNELNRTRRRSLRQHNGNYILGP